MNSKRMNKRKSRKNTQIEITCFRVIRDVMKDGERQILSAGPLCKTFDLAKGVLPRSQALFPNAYIGACVYIFEMNSADSIKSYKDFAARLNRTAHALRTGAIPVIGSVS